MSRIEIFGVAENVNTSPVYTSGGDSSIRWMQFNPALDYESEGVIWPSIQRYEYLASLLPDIRQDVTRLPVVALLSLGECSTEVYRTIQMSGSKNSALPLNAYSKIFPVVGAPTNYMSLDTGIMLIFAIPSSLFDERSVDDTGGVDINTREANNRQYGTQLKPNRFNSVVYSFMKNFYGARHYQYPVILQPFENEQGIRIGQGGFVIDQFFQTRINPEGYSNPYVRLFNKVSGSE